MMMKTIKPNRRRYPSADRHVFYLGLTFDHWSELCEDLMDAGLDGWAEMLLDTMAYDIETHPSYTVRQRCSTCKHRYGCERYKACEEWEDADDE